MRTSCSTAWRMFAFGLCVGLVLQSLPSVPGAFAEMTSLMLPTKPLRQPNERTKTWLAPAPQRLQPSANEESSCPKRDDFYVNIGALQSDSLANVRDLREKALADLQAIQKAFQKDVDAIRANYEKRKATLLGQMQSAVEECSLAETATVNMRAMEKRATVPGGRSRVEQETLKRLLFDW